MNTIKVWDPFVRLFHWSLVSAVIAQLVTAESYTSVHAVVGYFIVALLVLRILWGFIGPKYARFNNFIYPPTEIKGYLRGLLQGRPKHYTGHNPAGGAMVCVLLVLLLLITLTGLLTYGAKGKGPFASPSAAGVTIARADEDHHPNADHGDSDHDVGDRKNMRDYGGHGASSHFWKEIHETLVGVLIFLIVVHICGVAASSFLHKENLILAMITGRKPAPNPHRKNS